MRAKVIGGTFAAVVLASSSAVATELGPYSWTGFYVGGSLGGGWDGGDIDNTVTSTFCNPIILGAGCPAFRNALSITVPRRFDTELSGFIGGGQIGYNRQVGRFVWGVEADFSGTDLQGSDRKTFATPQSNASILTVTGTGHQEIDFLGTVRGRLGWTPVSPLLIYATGGLAYGEVQFRTTFSETLTPCICGPFPTTTAAIDEWRAGWTFGGGAEWMFAPHWTLRGQYLFYDLGDVSIRQTLAQRNAIGMAFFAADIRSTLEFSGSVATVGLNYKF